jgi:hypothetical protein
MRNLLSALIIAALFAGGLIWITNSPKDAEKPNPTPREEATKSARSLFEHVQGFFQDFEKFTYHLEKAISSDGKGEEDGNKASFILTFLGIMKFLGILIVFGLFPALGVATRRAHHNQAQAIGNIMEIDF